MTAALTIAGADVSCWAATPIQVDWGRQAGAQSVPDAATLTAVLRSSDTYGPAPIPNLGDRVTLDLSGYWSPLREFVGSVTDIAVEYAAVPTVPTDRTVSIVAADPLALLAGMPIGDEPWPAETADWRLARIEDAVQRAWPNTPGALALRDMRFWANTENPALFTTQLVATDIDRRPALEVLNDVAIATDSYLIHVPSFFEEDEPWGQILLHKRRWLDPAAGTFIPDPCRVESETMRAWSNRGQAINTVQVGYGVAGDGDQPSVVATDAAALADNLPRSEFFGTWLATQPAAAALADQLVAALASPSAGLDGVIYRIAWSDDFGFWYSIRDQRTGGLISLPAPDGSDHVWVVDGGTDDIDADGVLRTLSLSDSPAYVVPARWDDTAAGTLWDTSTPSDLRWDDIRSTAPGG